MAADLLAAVAESVAESEAESLLGSTRGILVTLAANVGVARRNARLEKAKNKATSKMR